jgi:hypothetical protein
MPGCLLYNVSQVYLFVFVHVCMLYLGPIHTLRAQGRRSRRRSLALSRFSRPTSSVSRPCLLTSVLRKSSRCSTRKRANQNQIKSNEPFSRRARIVSFGVTVCVSR